MSNLMKMRPVGAALIHGGRTTDGRTDTAKVISALENYANVPEKERKIIMQ
jgi:hypothetical protein